MQVSHNRGERAFLKASNFEPGRPPDIAQRPFHGNQIGGTCGQAASRKPTQKADSEIFNKFGQASGVAGVPRAIMTSCPMDSSSLVSTSIIVMAPANSAAQRRR